MDTTKNQAQTLLFEFLKMCVQSEVHWYGFLLDKNHPDSGAKLLGLDEDDNYAFLWKLLVSIE
jgi:hypothetical protein